MLRVMERRTGVLVIEIIKVHEIVLVFFLDVLKVAGCKEKRIEQLVSKFCLFFLGIVHDSADCTVQFAKRIFAQCATAMNRKTNNYSSPYLSSSSLVTYQLHTINKVRL